MIQRWFSKKIREEMHQYVVVDKDNSYFVQNLSNYYNKWTRSFKCLVFWLTTYLSSLVFQLTIGIRTDTSCAPIFYDLLLYASETDFLQGLLKNNDRKLAQTFIFPVSAIYAVLSLNSARFGYYLHLIYLNWAWTKWYYWLSKVCFLP